MEMLMTKPTTQAKPETTTILICANDPGLRAHARGTFTGAGWYVVESGYAELPQVARSVQIDVAVVISTNEGSLAIVRQAFVTARARIAHVFAVRHPDAAREIVRQKLGR